MDNHIVRSSNSDPDSNARITPQKYYGVYVGIVIQNNDPDKRGRVKVFVPHINATVYNNWDKIPKDKRFKFLGRNVNSDLNDILEDLKLLLPWADTIGPLVGATGSGRYNANLEVGTISDSSHVRTIQPRATQDDDKAPLNSDNIGEKPARVYEIDEYKISDGFTTTYRTEQGSASSRGMPNRINKFAKQYIPKSYSNKAKGSFSIPNVGAHVWVSFVDGDHNSPVIMGANHNGQDWRGIYECENDEHGPDYSGAYENVSVNDDSKYDHNTETYRNKYVLNQKGGTFEIVNTDLREILSLTHYSGSFMKMTNQGNIELCTGIDTKDVLDDSFLTVQGHRNELSERDYDLITRGDFYHKIGNFNVAEAEKWRSLVSDLSDLKQQFDVKRASFDKDKNTYVQISGPGSEREGKPAACPLCSAPNRAPIWDVNNEAIGTILPAVFQSVIGPLGPIAKFGAVFFSQFVKPFGPRPAFAFTQPPANPTNFLGDGNCPLCGGTGESPASEGGQWKPQGYPITDKIGQPIGKQGILRRKALDIVNELASVEKNLGLGGSQVIDIFKHKCETIGTHMNWFPSIRIDEQGTAVNAEVKVFKKGVATNMKVAPVVEQVDVTSLPGGDYNLTISNKFNCLVGAGGINLKTYGNVDFGGALVKIAGDEIDIAADNNINIVSKRINIAAEILSLRNLKYEQVLVESNFGVMQNVVIGGALHVEGELTCQHITGPAQINTTEPTQGGDIGHGGHTKTGIPIGEITGVAYGTVLTGLGAGGTVIINNWKPSVVVGNGLPNALAINAHSHQYKTIASHFAATSDEVRDIGKHTGVAQAVGPAPVENDDLSGPMQELFDAIPLPEIELPGSIA